MAVRGPLALVALTAALVGIGAAAEPSRAARPPVVLIVLDEFPVDTLLGTDGQIDARRFPGFADLARHSTWFPNAHTVYDSTAKAIPALLAGALPAERLGANYRDHPHNLFTFLGRLGYRMHVREEATTLCPPRLCRRTRNYGRATPNILFRRRERLEHTIHTIRRERRPVLTFHHAIVPHVPWSYLPSGKQRRGVVPGTLPDFGSPAGFGNVYLTQHNEQRYLLQLGFVDREIRKLLRRMRRQRVLDRSLLVITADHGVSFQVGVTDRRMATDANVQEIAPVPLFVKRPRQRGGAVSRVYASTIDVLPTIADVLGARLGRRVDGSSVFGATVGRRSGVRMVARDFSHTIEVPAAQMERRRRKTIAGRVALFGTGPWERVFQIGPDRQLLGRATKELGPVAAGRAKARFSVPTGLAHFDPHGVSAPVWVAGSIRGRGGADRRDHDLAVAVNGRIRAVARSFRLDGSPTEWFSVTVPESALRRGRNRVALFEVRTGAGGALSLRLLGRRS